MSGKTRILNKHKLSFALEIETHYYILAYVLSRMAYIASISIKLLCDPLLSLFKLSGRTHAEMLTVQAFSRVFGDASKRN